MRLETHHVISFLGGEEISRRKIETPRTLTEDQKKRITTIFSKLMGEANHQIRKLHFEIRAKDKEGNPLLKDQVLKDQVLEGHNKSQFVEIDIFFQQINHQNVPFMIDGEIEFSSDNPQMALRQAEHFRQTPSMHPIYFGRDISDIERLKSRNLASARLPGFIATDMDSAISMNQYYFSKFLSEFEQWMPAYAFTEATTPTLHNKRISNVRVLLNAEPFGFGPTSLIGEIFPYLRSNISHLSYIGAGHTLDLQRQFPYDEVYEYIPDDQNNDIDSYNDIAGHYDVFITACDFQAARWAKKQGLKVIIYDPLTWYWKSVPDIISQSDLYLSQNFFGVKQRLENESDKFPDYRIVPLWYQNCMTPLKMKTTKYCSSILADWRTLT